MKTASNSHYPQRFSFLVAEVADIAMRAMQQADPYDYVRNRARADALQSARLHRGITATEQADPVQRRAFREEIVRARTVRDLAIQLIASYHRLEQRVGDHREGETIVRFSPAAASAR